MPVFTFAVDKGGDDVDEAVGEVTGETATRVKAIKEEGLDLNQKTRSKVGAALHIYYEDLIETVVGAIGRSPFARRADAEARSPAARRPRRRVRASQGVRLSASPRRSKTRSFRSRSARSKLARDPLTATARGALLAALYEN